MIPALSDLAVLEAEWNSTLDGPMDATRRARLVALAEGVDA